MYQGFKSSTMILFLKDAVFFSSDIQLLLEEKASIDLLQVESRKVRRLIYSDISDTHTLTTPQAQCAMAIYGLQ